MRVRPLLPLLALGGLAWWFGRARSGPVTHMNQGSRNLALAGVGARTGGDLALTRARQVFASAERKVELDEEFQLRTAESVRDTLGGMKGAMMKIGQLASFLDQGLPEPVRLALAELQTSAPPMAPELVAEQIERELGGPPDELFAEWDPVPIASASIGQVHRAMTRDGRAVAVKVQYPGVDDAIEADLRAADWIFGGLGTAFPGLETEAIVDELRERLVEELDYVQEAQNQRFFAEAYAGHPYIHIPEVVPELSTRRVLTSELVDGVDFATARTWSQEERDRAAETIYRFAFGSLYQLRAFNGDPHPGNYLFHPGGRVTFLDFGLVKHFEPSEVEVFEALIETMVLERDIPAFRRVLRDAGLLRESERFSDEAVEDYFAHFYDFVLYDGDEYTITPEFASDTVRRMFRADEEHVELTKSANVPPSFVIIQRINLGLYAIFGDLHATGPWRGISEELWPFVSGPPTTSMGEEIARWERERRRSVDDPAA
ncbi:MAG: AarF/ABC1/UbiB kinase family protein [Actinomycetota bacterium]